MSLGRSATAPSRRSGAPTPGAPAGPAAPAGPPAASRGACRPSPPRAPATPPPWVPASCLGGLGGRPVRQLGPERGELRSSWRRAAWRNSDEGEPMSARPTSATRPSCRRTSAARSGATAEAAPPTTSGQRRSGVASNPLTYFGSVRARRKISGQCVCLRAPRPSHRAEAGRREVASSVLASPLSAPSPNQRGR
jgi:hypothetical protein